MRTRRELLTGAARLTAAGALFSLAGPVAGTLGAAPPSAALALPSSGFGEDDYWAFADWCQGALESLWSERHGSYGLDARVNAGMLVTHSVAALRGHSGTSRQDDRARLLAMRLTESPPYRPGGSRSTYGPEQRHTPGFVTTLTSFEGLQHVAVDPEIAEGLVFAWRARDELSLPASTVAAIERVVGAIASGRFFRYPSVRLNQCNWSCELYAYAAEVAGRNDLLRNDYRRQVARFLRGCRVREAPWKIANLSPSYGFHRDPFAPANSTENIESAEYANLVLGFVARYRQARAAGMTRLGAEELRTLRAWIERALPAYWTHGGYLNWDTGVRPGRWHEGNYWAFAFDGLLAVASAPAELRDPRLGRWAKHIFDRAVRTYVRLALDQREPSRIPGSPVFNPGPNRIPAHWLFATRFQSQVARAIEAGLGDARDEQPPPLYAFDPGNGRLAITTPSYNTAVVPVSNGAFSYGGIELARLFDGEQRVAACIGAHGPAGFGVTVTAGHSPIFSSQSPRRAAGKHPPLVLTSSPRGPVARGVAFPEHPYAGPFEKIQCRGTVRDGALSVHTTHTFTAERIRTLWELRRDGGHRHLTATVRFPTWGGDATIIATMRGGSERALGATPLPLAEIAHLSIRCGEAQSGYLLRILDSPAQSTLRAVPCTVQSFNPRPGPLLVLTAASGTAWRALRVAAEIRPGRDGSPPQGVPAS